MRKEALAVQLVSYAEQKLEKIIEREGTANGMRSEPWYLSVLLEEVVNEYLSSQRVGKVQGYDTRQSI